MRTAVNGGYVNCGRGVLPKDCSELCPSALIASTVATIPLNPGGSVTAREPSAFAYSTVAGAPSNKMREAVVKLVPTTVVTTCSADIACEVTDETVGAAP